MKNANFQLNPTHRNLFDTPAPTHGYRITRQKRGDYLSVGDIGLKPFRLVTTITMSRNVTAKSATDGPGKQRKVDDLPNCVNTHAALYLRHGERICPNCGMDLEKVDFTNQVGLGYFTEGP